MEITLKEIFSILKKGLIFIVITSVVFAACAFCYSKFFMKKTYTSTVKLYVETSETVGGNANNYYSNLNYAVALVNTYKEMLQTNKFYSQLSENLNNKYSATELSEMIEFSSLNETEVFEAVINADSPTAAKEIADGVAVVAPKMINDVKETATLKIVDDATLPTEPSAPNVLNITIMAFLAGLIISVIITIIRKVFDVKVSYNDEMTSLCGVPVLAAIPYFDNLSGSRRKQRESGKEE